MILEGEGQGGGEDLRGRGRRGAKIFGWKRGRDLAGRLPRESKGKLPMGQTQKDANKKRARNVGGV